jgi:manganese/zinc/iron transport system permease protein
MTVLAGLVLAAQSAAAGTPQQHSSITDHSVSWPTWAQLSDVLALRDYNTRVVVIGVSLLGAASGLIGSFLLLRKRALLADALSHATLPGIGIAFLLMAAWGGEGKWLPGLLAGASLAGVLGILCILGIVHTTRIKEDAALGIVLSVFFGLGVAILGVIQGTGAGNAAGLKSFIYGKTASMLLSDVLLILAAAGAVALLCAALFKEFSLLCFDSAWARAQGWPVLLLDVLMMAAVVCVVVIGLQAVGLILAIALLVVPAAAARFWTNHLPSMLAVAAVLGGLSGWIGAAISALTPRLPAGAIVVVVAGILFVASLIFGRARGLIVRLREQLRLRRRVMRQHLLRAMYELSESDSAVPRQPAARAPVRLAALLSERSWSPRRLHRLLRSAQRDGLVQRAKGDSYGLTDRGAEAAWRIVRNHRLWELFLITHADIAPSHVDRDADEVEHVLSPQLIAELEQQLASTRPDLAAPGSPHHLAAPGGSR